MANYYLSNDGNVRQGPFPDEELLRNGMTPNSLVWRKGMPGWKRAGEVLELAGYFAAQPQPQYQQGSYSGPNQYAFNPNTQVAYNQPQITEVPMPSFGEAIASCFENFANFKGRSRRSEFWWFTLFQFLLGLAVSFIPIDYLSDVASLVCLVPSLAVATRRLHDTGHSGWWLFFFYLGLIIFVFSTVMIFVNSGYRYSPDGNFYGNAHSLSEVSLFFVLTTLVSGLYTLVMGIILLVFFCTDSDKETNKYGVSPKYKYESIGY